MIFGLSSFSFSAQAQFSIGLYEGLMGRSGVATTESSAPSYYNPSLLLQRTKSSYSLSGNTVGAVETKNDGETVRSFTFQPSYMSLIEATDGSVHEFYIVNISPTDYDLETDASTDQKLYTGQASFRQSQFLFGYTMAFRGFPMGFNFYGSITDRTGFGFAESTSLVSNERSTIKSKSDFFALGVGLSMGTLLSFDSYSLGFHLRTRQVYLNKKDIQQTTSYVHTGLSPTDYVKTENETKGQSQVVNGHELTIGHSWANGNHEFLTDTSMSEKSDLTDSYETRQSFGYKLKMKSDARFLVGVNHVLGEEIRYFGQAVYASVGYSWAGPTLRNVIGMYYSTSRLGQDFYAYGLTFGSEFKH